MIRIYPRLWSFLVGLSLLITGLYYYIPVPTNWSTYLAVASILIIGIPHGAADHQLFSELYTTHFGTKATFKFYAAYLSAMLLVVMGWIWWPNLTLLLFILGSAYHFGQSNFQYFPKLGIRQFLIVMAWGLWIILTPIYFHFDKASGIIEILTQKTLPASTIYQLKNGWYLLTLLNVVGIITLLDFLTISECIKEGLTLFVLGCLFWQTPLLLGFGLFFSLWHAGPSVIDQIRFFRIRRETFWWRDYFLSVLPFSVVAILGILLAAYWMGKIDFSSGWWSVMFGGIAALTLPHLFVLDRVYARLNRKILH